VYLVAEVGDQVIELLGAASRGRDGVVVSQGRPDQGAAEAAG
jgi:hypothetical protein